MAGLSQITPASNDLFPFRDISGNTGGSVTLANLAVALGNNGVITLSNLVEQASALDFSRIQTGSYVGTGTYGSDNPCSLTFNFTPKLVFIHLDRLGITSANEGYYLWGSTTFSSYTGNSNYQSTASVSGNTMTWYASKEINAETQLNEIDEKYVWCAIG